MYCAMTDREVSETLLLRIAGMPWFDAVTTSFTTISTGGFSIRDSSIAYYNSEAIVWITQEGPFWGPRSLLGIEEHLYAFYEQTISELMQYYVDTLRMRYNSTYNRSAG